jgi:acetyl esterase/lipase
VLFCGAFDITNVDLTGPLGWFARTVLWAYSGRRDFMSDAPFAQASVARYVTDAFPRTFVSVGNADPLQSQSRDFAATLVAKGVSVDTLFFPADYQPPVPHVYLFNLDAEAGQEALARSLAFLGELMPRD